MGSRGTSRRDKQPMRNIIPYEGEPSPLAIRSPSHSPIHQITYPEAHASNPIYSPAQSKSASIPNTPRSAYIERAYLMDITIDEQHIHTDPIKLAPLYLLNHFNPTNGVKTREYYEAILMEIGFISVVHYYQQNTRIIAYSKVQIKKLLSYDEWGCNHTQGKKLHNPDFSYKYYKYAEYIEAWHKFFYYQNPNNTHSWYLQFRLLVFERFPTWFQNWFLVWGSTSLVLPLVFKTMQEQFVQYNNSDNTIETHLYFMALYQIPWIRKWDYTISVNNTADYTYIPRLGKTISVKWWDIFKMDLTTTTPKRIPQQTPKYQQSPNTANTSFDFPTYLRNMLQTNPNASKKELEKQMKEIFAEAGRKPVSFEETVQSSPLHTNRYLQLSEPDPKEESDPKEEDPDKFNQRP
ncbi:uncharacterized protein LOC110008348 [Amborella trichopoda]|uniref:uncharacterized protein LOC110008348 n=1 Tax=Amborella trichopoda TaxID=13333 RepID=UPI0009BFBB24|nr:uncharacterized protein LOC110008348 [Amborella trichopoda]|eukprot:XP_020530802.1 uncharacterized protein LOC110008348 [Amborella trichopoda]